MKKVILLISFLFLINNTYALYSLEITHPIEQHVSKNQLPPTKKVIKVKKKRVKKHIHKKKAQKRKAKRPTGDKNSLRVMGLIFIILGALGLLICIAVFIASLVTTGLPAGFVALPMAFSLAAVIAGASMFYAWKKKNGKVEDEDPTIEDENSKEKIIEEIKKDVVYLKNGSIIKGEILQVVPNEKIKLKTADGSIFVFKMEEVLKVDKEE